MQQVDIMEPGSQQRTTEKNVSLRVGQKFQSEGQFPDFLMDVLSRPFEPAKKGSAESQGESGKMTSSIKEFPDLTSVELATSVDQPENKYKVDLSTGFMLGTPELSAQSKEREGGDQENRTVQFAGFPLLESFFELKGNILKEFLTKTEDR